MIAVAVRPLVRESLHIRGTVVHVHLTGDRPLVFFDDYSQWIGDEIAPTESVTVGGLLAENGDQLLTESGDDIMAEAT
jgi:hypothetical protein